MLRTVHYIFNERDVGISTAGLDRDGSSSPIQAYLKQLKKLFLFSGKPGSVALCIHVNA